MKLKLGTRISFTGVGGAGKTTLANWMHDEYNCRIVSSVTRSVYQQHDLTETDIEKLSPEKAWELQRAIFTAHEQQQARMFNATPGINPATVSERTLIDHYSYSIYRCRNYEGLTRATAATRRTRAINQANKYDLIIHLSPPTWKLKDDGFRQASDADRLILDALIHQTLPYVDPTRVFHIESPDPRYRKQVIRERLDHLGLVC